MRSENASTYLFFLLLTTVTAVVFWPLYSGQYTLGGDASDLLLPVLSHLRSSLIQMEWPYWNPYQFQGLDTTVFPVYWNPLYLLCGAVFPNPADGLNALYLTLIFTAGIGFYKFSGIFLRDVKTTMLAGLCYPLLALFSFHGTDLGIVAAAALGPVLLYLNHRFLTEDNRTSLFQFFLGFFFLSTMTSVGFVLIICTGLLIQSWIVPPAGRRSEYLFYLLPTLALGGLTLWRIIPERIQYHIHAPTVENENQSISQTVYDILSFVFPQMKSMALELGNTPGAPLFHHYIGIILLGLAVYGLVFHPGKTNRTLGLFTAFSLILAAVGSFVEKSTPLFSGMTGAAFATSMKIMLSTGVLLLGLRGLEKGVPARRSVRYVFLGISVLGAGIAIYIQNQTGAMEPFHQTLASDAWKMAFFSILAALALWSHRSKVQWMIIALLILIDLGWSNSQSHKRNLFSASPIDQFEASIAFPENIPTKFDLQESVGRYVDQDFAIGSLDRNAGTLTKHIVQDGFWPWWPDINTNVSEERKKHLRYPLFYFTRDTTGMIEPTISDFNSEILLTKPTSHQWDLTIRHQYEKFLVFNQNYHRNWKASIDGNQIPVLPTHAGMMMIPIKPGSHSIQWSFRPDGIHHVFGFSLILGLVLVTYLLFKRQLSSTAIAPAIPLAIVFLSQIGLTDSNPHPAESPDPKRPDFAINYEHLSDKWMLRGDQLTISDSRSGYRSEKFDIHTLYSATLRLDSLDLNSLDELYYRFYIRSDTTVRLGVVFKTSGPEEDSHNIHYIQSLSKDNWSVVEGIFSLEDEVNPLDNAEWYIWNYENEDFLIDDIEIKLNP